MCSPLCRGGHLWCACYVPAKACMRLDPAFFHSPSTCPLDLNCLISWALSAGSHVLASWPHTVPIVHFSTLSWYSAKSAVTLSTHSAWRKLSGPCPNIMTPGAADAASSATSVGAKAGDPRFGHRSHGSGWRHRGGGYSCGSRSCHCCLSSTSNSIS